MIEEFDRDLSLIYNQQRKELALRAIEALYEFDFMNFEFELINIINDIDNIGAEQATSDIDNVLNTALNVVLSSFTIAVNDDTPMAIKIAIVEGIRALENYNDSWHIVSVIEDEEDALFAFCELLALVTEYDEHHYVDQIATITDDFLEKLKEHHNEKLDVEDNEEVVPVDKNIIERLRRFVKARKEELIISKLVENRVGVGKPYEHYLAISSDDMDALLPENKLAGTLKRAATLIAVNLLGFAIASPLPDNEILPTVKKSLDENFDDDQFISEITHALDEVYMKVALNG